VLLSSGRRCARSEGCEFEGVGWLMQAMAKVSCLDRSSGHHNSQNVRYLVDKPSFVKLCLPIALLQDLESVAK